MISGAYKELLRKKHKADKSWGDTGARHFMKVIQLLDQHECKSVLDYGCGKGLLGIKFREEQKPTEHEGEMIPSGIADVKFYEYDPGIEEKEKGLANADLVVCTDVLEHIEPQYIDAVIAELAAKTQKVAYLVISCREAIHKLPDGRNAHLIVQPPEWWEKKLLQSFKKVKYDYVQNTSEMYCVCR